MKTTFKNYPIYKKRDGQTFKKIGEIYQDGFIAAKKEFSKNCANDLQNECWLTYLNDEELSKKHDAGFYVNDCLVYNEDGNVNLEHSDLECFLSQKDIDKGFTSFSEDVYTWELRKN
jgi:hypothetical protein